MNENELQPIQPLDEPKTASEHIADGVREERNHNFYSANASFELAGDAGKYHRENFIKRRALKNPTQGWCLLNKNDCRELTKFVAEQARKRKLEMIRKRIEQDF